MKAIINAKLVLEEGILWNGILLMDGERIVDYGKEGEIEIPYGTEIIDACDKYVGPGFVDIHNHGGNKVKFELDPAGASLHFLNHGTTTVLAALYFDLDLDGYISAIERILAAKEAGGASQIIEGLYMEGPYMNPRYGSWPEKNKWGGPIDRTQYEKLVDFAGDFVRVWVVAPEREGIEAFVQYAKITNPDVVFSVGHSEATPDQVYALEHYGLKLQTHCTNATNALSDMKGTRGCGPDEACLYNSNLYAEVICDASAIHVKPHMLRMITKIKGIDKVVIITDSSAFDGDSPKELQYIKDLCFDKNNDLSGSKLTMDQACRNMMTHTDCGICQVFRMGCLNPAKVIGMDQEIGSIRKGKIANLLIVDDAIKVEKVILKGQIWQ